MLEKVGSCQKVAKESSSVWCNQIHIKEMHFSHKDNMMKVLLKKFIKAKVTLNITLKIDMKIKVPTFVTHVERSVLVNLH